MADVVVVNSIFTGNVFRKTFPSLRNRQLSVLYPVPNSDSLILPPEIYEGSSQKSYSPPNAERALGNLQEILGVCPKIMFLSVNRYERKKNIHLAFESFGIATILVFMF